MNVHVKEDVKNENEDVIQNPSSSSSSTTTALGKACGLCGFLFSSASVSTPLSLTGTKGGDRGICEGERGLKCCMNSLYLMYQLQFHLSQFLAVKSNFNAQVVSGVINSAGDSLRRIVQMIIFPMFSATFTPHLALQYRNHRTFAPLQLLVEQRQQDLCNNNWSANPALSTSHSSPFSMKDLCEYLFNSLYVSGSLFPVKMLPQFQTMAETPTDTHR